MGDERECAGRRHRHRETCPDLRIAVEGRTSLAQPETCAHEITVSSFDEVVYRFSRISGSVIRVLVMCVWMPDRPCQWGPWQTESTSLRPRTTSGGRTVTYRSSSTRHCFVVTRSLVVSPRDVVHAALHRTRLTDVDRERQTHL